MQLNQCPITRDEKRRMIAEAAYFHSCSRQSSGSDPIGDWLAAEADIERSLTKHCAAGTRRKKLEDYHRVGLVSAAERWWHRMTFRNEART